MKRAGAIVLMCLTLAACGGTKSKAEVAKATSNAQVQQDSAAAQQIIDSCVAKGNVITKAGRKAIIACIAPPGHAAQFEACAQSQLGSAHLASKAGRDAYLQAVVVCGEKNR